MSKDTKDNDTKKGDQTIAEWPRKIPGLDAAKKQEILERLESAVEVNHNMGMKCAERTFASIYDTLAKWTDVPKETIRIASGFGGGGASTSYGLCGAVTGALMGLGLFWGRVDPMEFYRTIGFQSVEEAQANPQQSAQFSRIFSAYMKEFENTFGSLLCGELVKDYLDLLVEHP